MNNPILKFKSVSKDYPGVKALNDVTFSLQQGEVLALLGENGAGKSTLIKCITGANIPSSGTIELLGKEYKKINPIFARKNGVGAVYQEFNLVSNLPVVENVFMGNVIGNGLTVNYNQMVEKCKNIFESFGVKILPTDSVKVLSPAMMQIVEIAKAIALDLKVLILDEPTAPLTSKETEILFKIIRDLKQKGVAIIYISHRLEEVFQICDRAIIMRDGVNVGEKLIKETNRQEIIKMMIGREITNYYPKRNSSVSNEIALSVHNVSGNGNSNISFFAKKREILGVAGLVGAGRTELMTTLFCHTPKESGKIEISGKVFEGKKPWHAIARGMAYLPEDRKRAGLLLDKSITINLTLASIKKFCAFGVINKEKEKNSIKYYCEKLGVKTHTYDKEVQQLSGGNQQKIIVAKWLLTESDILIFDEPTRGIDVGAKHEIYEIINKLADEGKCIIVVSSEFEELIGLCDRVIVMSEGSLVGQVSKENMDKEMLLDIASGNR